MIKQLCQFVSFTLNTGSWLDWNDWSTLTKFYSPEQAYGNSKVAQVLTTKHLARIMEAQVCEAYDWSILVT